MTAPDSDKFLAFPNSVSHREKRNIKTREKYRNVIIKQDTNRYTTVRGI